MNRKYLIFTFTFYPSLIVVLVVLSLLWDEPLSGSTLWLLVIFAAVMLIAFIKYYIAWHRAVKINNLLFEQCDPDAFLAQMQKRLNKAMERDQTVNAVTLRLNMGAGLNAAGRFDESLAVMAYVDVRWFRRSREGRLLRFVYHQNHCADFIDMKMMGPARDALLWLNDCVNAEKPGKARDRMIRHYRQDYYLYEMECGRYDGAEEVFQDMFDHAKNTYERVLAMATVGRIHEHFGRREQAREAYKYAAQQGNMLHAAAVARKKLKEI